MDLAANIEAILFFRAEPVSLDYLAKITKAKKDDVKKAIEVIKERQKESGLVLIEIGGDVALGTRPEAADTILELSKEEMSREISKAALETLSVILYQGPISKADIDWIRGVNSQFILRALLTRGLIEREEKKEGRSATYRGTAELLSHLGLRNVAELPEYESFREKIREITKESAEE